VRNLGEVVGMEPRWQCGMDEGALWWAMIEGLRAWPLAYMDMRGKHGGIWLHGCMGRDDPWYLFMIASVMCLHLSNMQAKGVIEHTNGKC
jgi:hypothetical protein